MGDWTVRVEVMLDHITTGHTDAVLFPTPSIDVIRNAQ